jgi:hypothetical protein
MAWLGKGRRPWPNATAGFSRRPNHLLLLDVPHPIRTTLSLDDDLLAAA